MTNDRKSSTCRDRACGLFSAFDANHGARRLYERCGYSRTAERPTVKEGWDNPGTNWVLVVKE